MSARGLPKALFITPTLPGGQLTGLSKRAAFWLGVLRRTHDVYVLVVPTAGKIGAPSFGINVPPERLQIANPSLREQLGWRIQNIITKEPKAYSEQLLTGPHLRRALKPYAGIRFDNIHVMRLYLAPVLQYLPSYEPSPVITLDLDDLESRTQQRLADLAGLRREAAAQKTYSALNIRYRQLEDSALPKCDRVFVCSKKDADELSLRGLANVCVVPNALAAQAHKRMKRRSGAAFNFLFVGNFRYLPNQDGVDWFISEILPLLRYEAQQPFTITLVGAGRLPNRSALIKIPELSLVQDAAEVEPFYQAANAAIVPLRAGGGTRIKIIEAFSFGVPVVSTALGIEGLEAAHDRHALIADGAEAFCKSCLRLMQNPELGQALSQNGQALFEERYNLSLVEKYAAEQFQSLTPQRQL